MTTDYSAMSNEQLNEAVATQVVENWCAHEWEDGEPGAQMGHAYSVCRKCKMEWWATFSPPKVSVIAPKDGEPCFPATRWDFAMEAYRAQPKSVREKAATVISNLAAYHDCATAEQALYYFLTHPTPRTLCIAMLRATEGERT